MPGEAARNADGGGGLFAASVLQGLERLGCRGVHVLACEAPAAPEWVSLPLGPHGSPLPGWRFGLGETGAGTGRAVLLEFADPDALDEDARRAVTDCLRAAAVLAPAGSTARCVAPVDRGDLSRHLHDLRNGLNSLLMNAAVLAAKLPPAEREGRFARQVQADGERCAALLQTLADATRAPGDGE